MSFPQIGGSAFGFGFQGPEFISGFLERDWAKSDAATAMQHSWRSAQEQMQFQERMSGTAYQRAVQDMQSAGLNPMLAYQQGGASAPQGAGFPGVLAHRTGFGTLGGSGSADLKFFTAAQVRKAEAEADLADQHRDASRELTPLSAEKLRKEAVHIEEDVARIRQDVQTGSASAEAQRALTAKMQAELPRVTAEIGSLVAQAKKFVEQGKLHKAEEEAVRQRLKEDLPNIERQLKDIERKLQYLKIPGAAQDTAAKDSYFNAVGNVLRALNPFLNR